ncbi:coiled-coil domain-containing protein 141 isoform X3 [Bemisia tabaci]
MLEAIPALTSLGDSLEEATQLQKTHEDVIMKIQSKQSPTEELLRKADQLIASQRPRPEVYAAMAESLSQAWEDVIKHLMRRRDILNLNVSYQSRAKIYFERVRALELLCSGSPIPDNVELIRENLEHLQEVKRAMLESLMSTLQEGEVMLETLRIVANEKRDSRPDGTRTSSLLAISQVEHWIEQLHDQRHLIEQIWARRRTLLEQSLALSLLATDLTLLESLLFDRHETLSRLKNNLGSSETEAKSLLESLQSLLPEAKELQEQSLKVLRAGEQLLMGGHPVNADSSKRGYSILQSSAEYIQELQGREELLNQAIQFYQSANNVFAELDKLQVEIDVQRQIDVSVIERLNQTTNEVIAQGRLILKEAPGAEGIKKVLEEIENRKVNLSVLYQEEHIKISELLNSFLEKQNELYSWLINDPDTFVRSNKDVGHSDIVARNQLTSHLQLLEEMQGKGCEINSLLMSLPHDFLDRLNSEQKLDVTTKIEELHKLWVQLKNVLERRVSLLSAFIRIYSKIQTVLSEFDSLESDIKVDGTMDDANFRTLREYWATTEAHFQELRQEETNFRQIVNESRNVYLDVDHAQQRIDALIKELTSRETRLSTIFSTIEAQICEHRKRIGDLWQQNMADSSKTMDWVSKLDSQLYPIINEETTTSDAVVTEIENKLNVILPEVKRTQSEIEARIQTAEALVGKGEAQDAVPPRLRELNEKLLAIISDYQNLADMLIKFFKNLSQVEETVIKSESNYNADSIENNLNAVDLAIDDHDSLKQSISECFRQSHSESVKVINQIKQQEPESAGERDISCIRRLLDMKRSSWERNWAEYKVKLEQKQQLCQFDTDLANINHHLDDLSKQLITIRGQYGESLSSAKSTSLAFLYFEKTVQLLEQRIETFITAAEAMLNSGECNSDHINEELGKLKKSREAFLEEVNKSRHLIDLSIQYFQLVEEAQEWFREGSKLLIMIARKTSEVERPDEINQLLEQIELFLKPEEVRQEERLDKISQLAAQIFGEEKPSTVEQMTSESQELVESFQSVCKELEALGDSYRKTEEMKMELDETVQKPSEISEENEHSELTIQEVDEEEEKEIQVDPIQESPPDERIEVLEKQDRKSPSPPPPEKKAKFNEEEKLEPPVFTEPLVPCTVQEGEKFILECRITGSPTPKIKWLKDNLSIENNPDYLTKFEDGICTLTIEETFAEDSAQFTCVATNEAGSVSTSAVLSVTEVPSDEHISAPEFVKPLQNTVTKEGEELELSCQVTGNPLPTVQWYKDDVCIDNSSDYVISYNNGEAILKLEKTTENDCGKYSCKATNASGSSYSHASVSVESKGSEEAVSKAPRFISPLLM